MHSVSGLLLAGASLLSGVFAQTPQGFSPTSQTRLGVRYNGSIEVTPGLLIPRPQVLNQPTITAPNGTAPGEYLLFTIDIDVARNNTRVPLLHWFQPNSRVASVANETVFNASAAIPGAPYIPPTPPGGDIPHRYVFLMFAQPPNFSIPADFSSVIPPASQMNRVGFNYTLFFQETGLGPVLAANYIQVQNTTQPSPATTYPSASSVASATAARSSVVPFTGGSQMVTVSFWTQAFVATSMAGVGALALML